MKRPLIYGGLTAAVALLFLLVPEIDLWVSGWFYRPQHGFVLRDWGPVTFIYHAVPWISWVVVLVLAVAAVWLFLMERPLWRLDRKALLFVAVSLALGPGLLVNTVLKDHWGRARPTQTEAFGGVRHFTPAPLPAAECQRNCSFVSGHAALGFSLVAFAFLLTPGRARSRGMAAALGLGGLVGLVRVAQGGHYLSDVIWAGLLVVGTTAVLHWFIVEKDELAAPLAIRCYRLTGHGAAITFSRLRDSEAARFTAAGIATAVLVVLSMALIDRPMALYLHAADSGVHQLFALIGRLGEAWGWLVLFALAFVGLHWGGKLPRMRGSAPAMRAFSAIPAFLFVSVAVAGLAADIVKIGLGRMRPKLLFGSGLYGFTWLAWRPDHWSFPSGHTATIVALMMALWWLWPQHLLLYILVAVIVAGCRIVVGAHYPSDVIAGAFVAVVATRSVVWMFTRAGIDLAAARGGPANADGIPPWPCRRFRDVALRRRAPAAPKPEHSLAPVVMRVVSARHGSADRDIQ